MKSKHLIFLVITIVLFNIGWIPAEMNWLSEKNKGYTLVYTSIDKNNLKDYKKLIETGIKSVKHFFDASFESEFSVYIHPNRQSLDSIWQKDWNMPEFKSECWMVASGVSTKLDMISPKRWDTQSCEHIYSESTHTQQLITHELIHIYHGQLNVSPDFSNTEGIDWFIEGMATFASGQCDTSRLAEVKKAFSENKIPKSLDNFWTGKIKYGLSGSVVMYIDHKYGREKLKALLPLNKKSEIFATLETTETELLDEWKKYIQNL
jgi:hypothetical protein